MSADRFKEIMKEFGITYADIGVEVDRVPGTVKQRLNNKKTFHLHEREYRAALKRCIEKKQEDFNDKLKELEL